MTRKFKGLTALIVTIAMMAGLLPVNISGTTALSPIQVEAAEVVGAFTVEGDSTGYSYADNVLTISGGGDYVIGMATAGATTDTDTIKVTSETDVNITLDSVLISNGSKSPFEVNATGGVTLKLKGKSSLTSTGDFYAGLQKTSEANLLTITSVAGDGSTEGSLTVTGGYYAAGIGGDSYDYIGGSGSNITISGGTVTATTTGDYGAAIGGGGSFGGVGGSGSNITISGGKVTATSINGAGIGGGGLGGIGTNISIEGGTVTATSTNGAGIGSGSNGYCSNINISGGTVTATGTNGAAIGGGKMGEGSNITITGGNVTATSTNGKAIGDGRNGSGSSGIKIIPEAGKAISYKHAEANDYSFCQNEVDITNDVTTYFNSVPGAHCGAFIVEGTSDNWVDGLSYSSNLLTLSGSGDYVISMANPGTTTTTDTILVNSTSDVNITLDSVLISNGSISPFEVNATGDVTLKLKGKSSLTSTGNDYAGLQKNSTDNLLTITGIAGDGSTEGSLTATSGRWGAAIGGGIGGSGSHITISGGTVTATSTYGAGIGGGDGGSGSDITISGGTVTAHTVSAGGAGIGGGSYGNGSNIAITGGTVIADGSGGGAGIGGGNDGIGSNITITGGTVTATSNDGGAGIGGGNGGSGSNITISGGNVTATSDYGKAIGDGAEGSGSSEIYIEPDTNFAIYAKYAESGEETTYTTKTDVTESTKNTKYFNSRTVSLLPYTDPTGDLNAEANSLIIRESNGSTEVYYDLNSNGIVDEGDTLFASGNLTAANITTTGSLITVLGGSMGTLKGNVNSTTLNISGSPSLTIDLTTISGNAVNVTGAMTSAEGLVKVTGATAGATIANVAEASYMTINDEAAVHKAFSAEGLTLNSYTENNTVAALSGDEAYTMSLALADTTATNYNANEEIKVNVAVTGGNVNTGSVQFGIVGGWFDITKVETTGNYELNQSTKQVAITGLNVATATGATVATLTLKVKNNITTTADAEISFAAEGNYITPVGSLSEIKPTTTGTTVNIYNIKLTLNSGNGLFNNDESLTDLTAYVRYNEAGLYTDSTYETEFTMPTLSPKAGYRLAAGTNADPLWADDTNTYINDEALTSATFTADTTVTLQTMKQWTVTINQPNEVYGTISNFTSPVIVDNNTTLNDIVKDIVFTPSVTNGYMLTGWNVDDTQVSNVNLSTTYITKDVSISPIIAPCNYKISAINTTKANVGDVAVDDTVTYGTDVIFTVTPEAKATTYSVYYTVGNNEPKQLTVTANNSYTIPGSEIVDNISIEVVAKTYYEITFTGGDNATMTAVTAYAWESVEGLYDSIDGLGKAEAKLTAADITSGLSANDTYRLAADTIDEPLWYDGTSSYTTGALVVKDDYSDDVNYSANTIKQYQVTFIAGDNGDLDGTITYTVDTDKTLQGLPTIVPNANYSFKCWDINGTEYTSDELSGMAITTDLEVTAVFEPSKYSINFAETAFGTFEGISGVTDDGFATYLTDVSFTFVPNNEQRIERVYYTVAGVEMTDLVDNGNGSYTIPGGSITGAINVVASTQETKVFTFLTQNSEMGTVSGITSFILDLNSLLTTDKFDSVKVEPNTGYTFTNEWMVDDFVSSSAIVVPTEVPADRNITFYAQFKLTDFNVTDSNNAIEVVSGLEGGYAHMGTDLVIKIKDNVVATGLTYTIGDGQSVALTPNDDSTFTIPGSAIIGDVTINANVIDGAEFMFITKEEYVGTAVSAFPNTRKIAVLKVNTPLAEGNFSLIDGREFFYSERYGAYLMIVDSTETAESMTAKLAINSTATIRTIDYGGDLNGTGTVTAGDAGMINDILKNQWNYAVTDKEFLMMDVEGIDGSEGYQKIYTSDVVWVLKESIGLN